MRRADRTLLVLYVAQAACGAACGFIYPWLAFLHIGGF